MRFSRVREMLLVIFVLFWCIALVYFLRSSESLTHNSDKYQHAIVTMDELVRQNTELKQLIADLRNSNNNGGNDVNFAIQKKLNDCLRQKTLAPIKRNNHRDAEEGTCAPSDDHEKLVRHVYDDVMEMSYAMESELKKLEKENPDAERISKTLQTQQKTIMIDIEDLRGVNEGWRNEEARKLRDLVRKRIDYVQNPANCNSAKRLLCKLNKGCGFGCQIHHLLYCFMIAYGTQRTLVLDSTNWRYSKEGWESTFLPLSRACTSTSGSADHWRGEAETRDSPLVLLPIVDGLSNRPPYMPLGIPRDLAPALTRVHGDPGAWWVGQFMTYLWRPQPWLEQDLTEVEQKFGFENPIVGIQVRRTDKVGTEAAFHAVEEYMSHVTSWYDRYELRMRKQQRDDVIVRRVYVATDDAKVLPEARKKYPKYVFYGDTSISESAGLRSRYTKTSLRGVIIDIHFLSRCDFLVCTFSSQVCRVAYELMQSLHADASAHFHSLDDVYYFGGQTAHEQVARYDHDPPPGGSSEQIELRVGDVVGLAGNHWDGWSKGRNRRTGQTGLYPSYKTVELVPLVDYPTYPEADSDG